jgi:hypothetical protein
MVWDEIDNAETPVDDALRIAGAYALVSISRSLGDLVATHTREA